MGATGYTGFELVRLLVAHPQVKITFVSSERYVGERYSKVFPALAGVVELECRPLLLEEAAEEADLVFSALPHQVSQDVVPALLKLGKRTVDLSADFRLRDQALYEAYYGPHKAADLLSEAVYGLTEINRDQVEKGRLVSNPGCYATGAILALAPLTRERIISSEAVVVDAKSGVSGAGRGLSLTTHFCEVNESVQAYKVAEHRHQPEMEQELSRLRGEPVKICFTPHLIPMSRGILTTAYAQLVKQESQDRLIELFRDFYRDCPFVRVMDKGLTPATGWVRGTNFCDIGVYVDPRAGRVISISAIDNLGKGASGQAIQNMNVMAGFPETWGLSLTPPFP